VLVVEYKGAHIYDNKDSEEKRSVGAVWAARSGGKALFVMPTKMEFGEIETVMSKQP
jgi:type III restriction enzyme